MVSIKLKLVTSAKVAKSAITALPRKAARMAKRLATRVHPACPSPTASTHPMALTNDAHGAPMHLAASAAELEEQVAYLERKNANLRAATPKAVHEAQVAYVSALVQEAKATHERLAAQQANLDQAYAALLEIQQARSSNHDQAMARLALRIEITNTLTADHRIEHGLMVARFTDKCTRLAEECDRLKCGNKALEEQTLSLSSDVAIQDRHLDILKRAMRRRQARISSQSSE